MSDFIGDKSKLCQLEKPRHYQNKNIGLMGFSLRGESHKKDNKPGQDANCIFSVQWENYDVIIATIADGVGSAALSHYGASIAARNASSYLKDIFAKNDIKTMDTKTIGNHIKDAMKKAKEEVRKEARDNQQLEFSYQSTLTIAIYDGNKLYFGHIGDDGIVALTKKGELGLITERHKGEEFSSVYPLQTGESKWQIGMVTDDVDGFVMATDGVLDAFVKSKFENNRIYFPFIEPAFKSDSKTDKDFEKLSNDYLETMNTPEIRRTITDDITFISCINTERIMKNPYQFDDEKWKKEDEWYKKQRNKALYGDDVGSNGRLKNRR